MSERSNIPMDTIELLKYEISVDGRGIIEGGRVREHVSICGTKSLNVRKAYAPNGIYKVGWVYDFDVSYCMVCMSEFGWFIRRHHCRACGYVVCGECCKYRCKVAGLPEELESRICSSCYLGADINPGGRFSPSSSFDVEVGAKEPKSAVITNIYASPIENDMQHSQLLEDEQKRIAAEEFERLQARNYAHAYRVMRGIVPPDITSTNLSLMLRQGLPALVAKRVWTCGALWLICMHSTDIGKIHIADLRSRYATVGLDIVEMRAIWNILPKWPIDDPATQAKAEWRNNFKVKLDSLARAEMDGSLSPDEKRHPVYAGHEPILVYNHRIPLDAKYDKIDSYGHVIYTGIDEEGNPAPLQFYNDPNPIKEDTEEGDELALNVPTAAEPIVNTESSAALVEQESVVGTPSTIAQDRTPNSFSPFLSDQAIETDVSPVSRYDADNEALGRRSISKGIAAGKYREHLATVPTDAPPPPAPAVGKASPRRRPPPLPAPGASASPLAAAGQKLQAPDSWLNTANMPDSPADSELSLPVMDPNASTPPPSSSVSTWKPAENPAQRIGGGYGVAALVPDSDDEFSQKASTPQKTPITPGMSTPASICAPAESSGSKTPSISPLVLTQYIISPLREEIVLEQREISISDFKGLVLQGNAEALNDLFDGVNIGCRSLRVSISPSITEMVANQLFMQVCREPTSLKEPKETLIILVKDFHADVNYVGDDGKSGLISLLLQPDLATVVINLGASILIKGKMTACPLSICLELSDQGILDGDWLIDVYERSNSFNCLSRSDAMEYFTRLIFAGRHLAASRLIGLNRVQVSADEASSIMKRCNFETMKDSLETYELLEKLGGQF